MLANSYCEMVDPLETLAHPTKKTLQPLTPVDHTRRLSTERVVGFWAKRWNSLSLGQLSLKDALEKVHLHIIEECKRALQLSYFDVTQLKTKGTGKSYESKYWTVGPDEDIKEQLLDDFKTKQPELHGRLEKAVKEMPREHFVVLLSPEIQQQCFSLKSITAHPPLVFIKRLPMEIKYDNKRRKQNYVDVPLTIKHRVEGSDSMNGDYPDVGVVYVAAYEYRKDNPQAFVAGMTIEDDEYRKGQCDMHKEFRMKAAICANDRKIVTSVSVMQMGNTVISNL